MTIAKTQAFGNSAVSQKETCELNKPTNFVVLVGTWELDGWTATLVYLGTIIMGLRQIAFGSQVNVHLADTRIEMLLLVVTCAETGDMWNKTTASGRKVVLDANNSPL